MNQREAFLNRSSHEHNDKDDFRTPGFVVNWLKSKFGPCLRDGACTIENMKGTPINVFGVHLLHPDEWVYVNPPFDTPSILSFIDACVPIASNNTVVFLLPNKLCQKSFCQNVNHHFDEIYLLGGRLNFESPFSVKGGTSMNGCFIGVIYCDLLKKNERPVIHSLTISELKKEWEC